MKEGSKVKSYVHFRGRTIVFRDRGELVLLRFIKELAEHGSPEAMPKMEGRRMIVVIAPKKSALKKPVKKKNKHERRKEEADKADTEKAAKELQKKLNEEEESINLFILTYKLI